MRTSGVDLDKEEVAIAEELLKHLEINLNHAGTENLLKYNNEMGTKKWGQKLTLLIRNKLESKIKYSYSATIWRSRTNSYRTVFHATKTSQIRGLIMPSICTSIANAYLELNRHRDKQWVKHYLNHA